MIYWKSEWSFYFRLNISKSRIKLTYLKTKRQPKKKNSIKEKSNLWQIGIWVAFLVINTLTLLKIPQV